MLTKNEIVQAIAYDSPLIESLDVIAQRYGIGEAATDKIASNVTKVVLDALAALAQKELEAGDDFTVPGVAKVAFKYRKPLKKGEKRKKGEQYVGFGGIEQVAEEDSKPVTEQVKLIAAPAPLLKRSMPGPSKPAEQSAFFKTKTGKAVRARKG